MAAILLLGPVPTPVATPRPDHAGAQVIILAHHLRPSRHAGPVAAWQRDAEGRLVCRWLPGPAAGDRPR